MPIEHRVSPLGQIHIMPNWEVANAAALAALVVAAGDIGKVALQQDTNVLYLLQSNVGPVWITLAQPDGSTLDLNASNQFEVKAGGVGTTQLANAGGGAAGPIGDATHVAAVTVDAKGRVTALSSVGITQPTGANPTASIGASAVNGAASSFMRSDGAPAFNIAGLTAKSSPVDADNLVLADSAAANALKSFTGTNLKAYLKAYFDQIYAAVSLESLNADWGTTGALPAGTYVNGVGGIGATFTATATGAVTVEGHTLAINDRLLVQNQASNLQNGLYVVTIAGALGVALVLTRSADMNQPAEFNGAVVLVINGATNGGKLFVQNSVVNTVGTDSVTFVQLTLQVAVSSVFGRTGAVVATSGDYTAAQVTNAADKSSASAQNFSGQIGTHKGANISSANNLAPGADGNIFHVTGSTQINLISSTNVQSGSFIVLIFDSTPLVKHNQAVSGSNMPILLLNGVDWTPAANDMLVLWYDGTSFYDIRRGIQTSGAIITENHQTGTSYSLALTDIGGFVNCDNAGAFSLTVPANSSVAFPVGTVIQIAQGGAGQVTIAVTTDTFRTPNGAKTAKQYSVVSLYKRAATEWYLSGDSSS